MARNDNNNDDDDEDDLDEADVREREREAEEQEEEREDLISALRQARRKPRHFAIIARGPEVLALMAQKKPFRQSVLRQERREKRGKKVIQGLCQGDGGAKLVFKVAGELPKIKKSRLREFISDATGLMLKPRFETGLPAKT